MYSVDFMLSAPASQALAKTAPSCVSVAPQSYARTFVSLDTLHKERRAFVALLGYLHAPIIYLGVDKLSWRARVRTGVTRIQVRSESLTPFSISRSIIATPATQPLLVAAFSEDLFEEREKA